MPYRLCMVNQHDAKSKVTIDKNFEDLHRPFDLLQAKAEASNCLYCYDAPCIKACPTAIDIPTFIHQIRSNNLLGSAKTILSSNIMAGTCARACPTEILCEQACVLNSSEQEPVKIGELQRYAVDHLIDLELTNNQAHPFQRQSLTGKKIAIIGAGPAGMSCAHKASMLGHDVTIYEAKSKAGGLNEFGLAAYKMVDDFAQREISFLLNLGGIETSPSLSLIGLPASTHKA
ncbi:MAG: NAD(P)-binding protein [Erythrobacter sp.]|nr:NAD(P)-binding protein [Erythrobacter sp.]